MKLLRRNSFGSLTIGASLAAAAFVMGDAHAAEIALYTDASGLVAGKITQPIRLVSRGISGAPEAFDLEFDLPNGSKVHVSGVAKQVGVERLSITELHLLNRVDQDAAEAVKSMAVFAYEPRSRMLLLAGEPHSGAFSAIRFPVSSPLPYDYTVTPSETPPGEISASLRGVLERLLRLKAEPQAASAEESEAPKPRKNGTPYFSKHLNKELSLVDYPPYLSVPTSFISNDDQLMGVIVEKQDSNHFLLEWNGGIEPILIDKETRFLEWRRKRASKKKSFKELKNEDFEGDDVRSAAGISRLRIGDVVHVSLRKIDTSKEGKENWARDARDAYATRQVVIFERDMWPVEEQLPAEKVAPSNE